MFVFQFKVLSAAFQYFIFDLIVSWVDVIIRFVGLLANMSVQPNVPLITWFKSATFLISYVMNETNVNNADKTYKSIPRAP